MVYTKAIAQTYFPWMDCYIRVARSSARVHWEVMQTIWEDQSAAWSFQTCAHHSFSDKTFGKKIEDRLRTFCSMISDFECRECGAYTFLSISGSPACLTVETIKYLGEGLKTSVPEWKRHIPTEDKQNDCGFGQRWKADSVLKFLGH